MRHNKISNVYLKKSKQDQCWIPLDYKCLDGSRCVYLFALVCAWVIKLSLSGSQSDIYWIVTIKHSGEPRISVLWVFCQCFALSQNQWALRHHAMSRLLVWELRHQCTGIPWVHIMPSWNVNRSCHFLPCFGNDSIVNYGFLKLLSCASRGHAARHHPCYVPVCFHISSFFQFPKRGNCKCKDFKEVLKVHLGFRWVNLTKGFKNVSRSHFTLKSSQCLVANTHKDEDEQGIPEYIALFT